MLKTAAVLRMVSDIRFGQTNGNIEAKTVVNCLRDLITVDGEDPAVPEPGLRRSVEPRPGSEE